jgi:hypothetical protein
MATMLEEYITKEQRSFVQFSGQKGSMQMIFIEKCFLFMVRRVYPVKRFITGSKNSLKAVQNLQMMPNQVTLSRLRQKQL